MPLFSDLKFQYESTSPLPKYKQIANMLGEYLKENRVACGTKLPNDRDLAEHVGTAVMTLSRALNELVSEGLLERRVGAGTYVRDCEKQKKSLKRIAIVCHQPITTDGGFVSTLLSELSAQAAHYGVDLLQLQRSPAEYAEMIHSYQLDGIIVLSATPEFMPLLSDLAAQGVNLAQVGVWHRNYRSFSFGTDHKLVALQAVKKLISAGHKSIGFIVGKQIDGSIHVSNSMRIEGYQRGMWEARLPVNPSWIVSDVITAPSLESQFQALIDADEMPDAFLLGSLPMAPRLYHILQQLHLRVPEDIALVAFDDSYLCEQMTPSLTAYSQNIPELVRQVLGRLTGQSSSEGDVGRPIPSILIERKSC